MIHDANVTVAGGGSWGTALAHVLAEQHISVNLWLRDSSVAKDILEFHENKRYLPNIALNKTINASCDPSIFKTRIVILAIPVQQLRSWLEQYKDNFLSNSMIINAAKGLEVANICTCNKIVHDVLGDNVYYGVISGPSFAKEVVMGKPVALVLAIEDKQLGQELRELFSGLTLRCYSSTDVLGVELGGAVKNVMAIAAGICDGLGLGDNCRAALITRGLAEMIRMGTSLGAKASTFMGLSGLGDLVLTCTGDLSRNRQVGLGLGRGETLEAIISNLGMVAEGVKTTDALFVLSKKYNLDMPILNSMYRILHGEAKPSEEVNALMQRALREE